MPRPKILVIDDDRIHLVCAKELLEEEGYEVYVHESAFGATEKVLRHHSSNDEDALRRSAERLGIDGYVCKGDPEQLRRRVAIALRRR